MPAASPVRGAEVSSAGSITSRELPASEAEQLLQAIRASLIEAATGAPVRVVSSAWVDETGALHESTQWHSQLRVRGVRVLQYLEPEREEPKKRWNVQAVLEPAERRATANPQECLDASRPWRMAVRLEISQDPRLHGPEAAVSALLAQQARAWWAQHGAGLPRWYAQAPIPVSVLPIGTSTALPQLVSAYQQALVGSSPRPSGTVLRLALVNASAGGVSASLVFEDGDNRVIWRQSQLLTSAASQNFAGAAELAALEALLQRWREALATLAPCEFPRFDVLSVADQRWVLPVGLESGFLPGQRVFIADRSRVPARILEPDALGQTALAEVVSVSSTEVALRQVAGPRLSAGARWVAWPL
jgi:hypothetical protein